MPIGEDGPGLAERLTNHVPQALTNAAATFVDSLKINSISEKVRRGRRVVIKRRNVYGEQLADLANLYFRMSGIPQRRSFSRFHFGTRTVCFDKMHGKSLWEHLNEGTLTRRTLEAAGAELRRGASILERRI
jgi:hypothetical protein